MAAFAPSATAAQDERETATARSLFEQGVKAAAKQDWPTAADLFARSNELRRSPVVAYNLATAWVELGRLVEAAELLRQIEKDEKAKPGMKKDARSLLAQLEPRIGTLVVVMESDPPPKEVRVNDQTLPEAALGVPTPIDPGSVLVTVVEGGVVLWTQRVEVTPGGEQRITIALPKSAPAPAPAVVPTPTETANRATQEPAPNAYDDGDLVDDEEDRELYEEPWVWVGAGAVVAAGVVVVILLASGGDNGTDEPDPITGSRLEPGTLRVTP